MPAAAPTPFDRAEACADARPMREAHRPVQSTLLWRRIVWLRQAGSGRRPRRAPPGLPALRLVLTARSTPWPRLWSRAIILRCPWVRVRPTCPLPLNLWRSANDQHTELRSRVDCTCACRKSCCRPICTVVLLRKRAQ
jgi:hypothetical protein